MVAKVLRCHILNAPSRGVTSNLWLSVSLSFLPVSLTFLLAIALDWELLAHGSVG